MVAEIEEASPSVAVINGTEPRDPRVRSFNTVDPFQLYIGKKKKVRGKRYEARSRGRSSPDTLAF